MTEWEVFGVIVAVIGLLAVIIPPIVKAAQTNAKTAALLDSIVERMDRQEQKSHESHQRLWDHNTEQDNLLAEHGNKIANHEVRIGALEKN